MHHGMRSNHVHALITLSRRVPVITHVSQPYVVQAERRLALYLHLQTRGNHTRTDDSQRVPLAGYYAEILAHQHLNDPDPPAVPSSAHAGKTTEEIEREEREERARAVFGTRQPGEGPGKEDNLSAKSTVIAGVTIPPKPAEPENCCMSGCVHCVWDIYREDLEEWTQASAKAQAILALEKGASNDAVAGSDSVKLHTDGKTSSIPVSVSIGENSSGETTVKVDADVFNAEKAQKEEDPFAKYPVGIREFMRMEKMLKDKDAQGQ